MIEIHNQYPFQFHQQSEQEALGLRDTIEAHKSEIERSVRFRSKATTRFILSRNEYTPEEMIATWYQREEYINISKDYSISPAMRSAICSDCDVFVDNCQTQLVHKCHRLDITRHYNF